MAWEAIQTRRIKPHDIGEGTLRRHAAGTVSFPVLCKNRNETLMSVLVIGRNGRALMPTYPRKARLLLKKKTGKLTGWVGYTYSSTERLIDGINNEK